MLAPQYKSDKRVKGGVTGHCKLCGENKILRLSHIVPNWMFDEFRKETDKGHFIGSFPSLGVNKVIKQDGNKHYMLCEECEQKLSHSEKHIKSIIIYDQKEINYELIQRFVLSVAFKAHYATSAPYHNININSKFLRIIKEPLLKRKFTRKNIRILASQFYSKVEGLNPKAILFVEGKKCGESSYFFTILCAGWEWALLIDKRNKFYDFYDYAETIIKHDSLDDQKPFKVLQGDIEDHRFIQKYE